MFWDSDPVFGCRRDLLCLHGRETEDDGRVPNGGPEDACASGRGVHFGVVPVGGPDSGTAGGDVHQGDAVFPVAVWTAGRGLPGDHPLRPSVLPTETHELL